MAKSKKKSSKKLAEKKLAKNFKSNNQSKSLNPFEVHLNKQKRVILGQKSKNDRGLPGVSRAKSLKKRKETLLQELKVRHKTNSLIDRRIGEKDSNMSKDQMMLVRFASEKKKQHKANLFNLNEDEELTHHGQSLSAIERFEDPRSDSEDESQLDANFVSDANFGGFLTKKDTNSDLKNKSRTEIIEEMISKSKQKKHEMKVEREATMDLTDKIDSQWKEMNAVVALMKRKPVEVAEKDVDDFDKMVRELKFEIRGKPTDRLKSAEEIALEEKQRLEELEAERVSRMKGIMPEEATEKHKSADDLDDGFQISEDGDLSLFYDEQGKLHTSVPNESEDEDKDADEMNESDEASSESSDESDEEENDVSDNYSDMESNEDSDEEENESSNKHSDVESNEDDELLDSNNKAMKIKNDLMVLKKVMSAARKEVPYTFEVPEDLKELDKMLESYDTKDQVLVIERMIKCNHPSLNEANKAKLENLFVLLIIYLMDKLKSERNSKIWILVNQMVPIIYGLNQFSPDNNGRALSIIIFEKHEEFDKLCKKKLNVPFPDQSSLYLFKLLPILFSASDFKHPVITPAFIFMSQILTKCKLRSTRDIFLGLHICEILKQYVCQSKKIIPEVINFLLIVLSAVIKDVHKDIDCNLLKTNMDVRNLLHIDPNGKVDDNSLRMNLSDLCDHNVESTTKLKASLTRITLLILKSYIGLYKETLCYKEIFKVHSQFCHKISTSHPSNLIKDLSASLCDEINNSTSKLIPLVREKKKPPSIKFLEPKIEENFTGQKKPKGDKQHAEKQKLLQKYKQEMKGAMREIRKDNQFLARELLQNQLEKDEERKLKVKRLLGELAGQEGDYQAIKRKKNAS